MPLLVLFFVFSAFFLGTSSARETIRITNGEWAPYLSENLKNNGFASHVVKEAFSAVDMDVQYGFFPWKRAYKLAREGKWNASVVWVYTPQRAKDFYYSDVVVTDSEYLFHLKEFALDWKKVEDLKGITIGGTLHTVYPVFEQAQQQGILTIERAGTYENLYRRLLKKRIDAIPQVWAVGKYLIRTTLEPLDQDRITFSPSIVQTREYCLIFSKELRANKPYLKRFNQGLSIIKKNGRYAQLHQALEQGDYDK